MSNQMQSNFVRNTPEDVLHITAHGFKQYSYLLLLPIDLLLFSSVNLICALFFLSNNCHTSDCSNHAQKTSFRIQPVPLLKKVTSTDIDLQSVSIDFLKSIGNSWSGKSACLSRFPRRWINCISKYNLKSSRYKRNPGQQRAL